MRISALMIMRGPLLLRELALHTGCKGALHRGTAADQDKAVPSKEMGTLQAGEGCELWQGVRGVIGEEEKATRRPAMCQTTHVRCPPLEAEL